MRNPCDTNVIFFELNPLKTSKTLRSKKTVKVSSYFNIVSELAPPLIPNYKLLIPI
jgi:hypothetical protein